MANVRIVSLKHPSLWTASILLAVAVVATGCSAATPAPKLSLPPVPPLPQPSPLPVSHTISVTADQLANADPCDLIDQNALSILGTATLALNQNLRSCDAEFDGGSDFVGTGVTVEFSPHPDNSDQVTGRYQGVTIYHTQPALSGSCARSVIATSDAVLTIESDYVAFDSKKQSPCPIADRAIKAAVSRLVHGGLRPANYAANSLARQDACRLIAQQEANQIPGINRADHDSGYRGQYCQWGEGPIDQPGLYLAFDLSGPAHAGNGWRPITVAKRHAFIHSFPTDQNELANCEIQLINRRSYRPSFLGNYELFDIAVTADQSAHANCSLVTDLATKALTRMARHT